MAHSHTHAPGEEHSHSHGPQQAPVVQAPDPSMQALIDQDFTPVSLKLGPDEVIAQCAEHSLEKCDECGLDFGITNRLARLLKANPQLLCPPPSNVVNQQVGKMVQSAKDEGNNFFKLNQQAPAIQRYTSAAAIAIQRPPWEANHLMREDLSTVISNRSAAYHSAHDYISALADAETVIAIRRNWPKGHFRKSKALMGLKRFREAADAVKLGLSFEPTNTELLTFLTEIEKLENKSTKTEATVKSV